METSTMRHLRLAAGSGGAAAQFNLGVLFDRRLGDNGYAIEGNRAESLKWLLAAAEQGLPRAQSRLAEVYAGGPKPRKTSGTLAPGFCARQKIRAAFTATRLGPGTNGSPPG